MGSGKVSAVQLCSYVCPHAVIRPYLLDTEEAQAAPDGFKMCGAKGPKAKEYKFSLQVSALDCTGCGSCVSVCPAKEKAIVMRRRMKRIKAAKTGLRAYGK